MKKKKLLEAVYSYSYNAAVKAAEILNLFL